MRRSLYIVRHANAESHSASGHDFDRQLSESGVADAIKMGSWFQAHFSQPTYWASSAAPRCAKTAQCFADQYNNAINITLTDSIYEAPYQRLLSLIQLAPDDAQSMVLFGHNPGVSYLVSFLTGHRVGYETGMVCELSTDQHWGKLDAGSCQLVSYQTPTQC